MKKTPKQNSHKHPARYLPASKSRKNFRKKKDERSARTQWLQILSEETEEDQAQDAGHHPLPQRNGRRAAPEINLYVVERGLRSARRFR
jgi:hypothetical protein